MKYKQRMSWLHLHAKCVMRHGNCQPLGSHAWRTARLHSACRTLLTVSWPACIFKAPVSPGESYVTQNVRSSPLYDASGLHAQNCHRGGAVPRESWSPKVEPLLCRFRVSGYPKMEPLLVPRNGYPKRLLPHVDWEARYPFSGTSFLASG